MRKWLLMFGSVAGAFTAIASAWLLIGGPIPASREWVQDELAPLRANELKQLYDSRLLRKVSLFQWERNNPTPSPEVYETIERLRAEIAEIDREIAAHRR
jgi:hypothetical protein